MAWLLGVAVVVAVLGARRRGWRSSLLRQAVAWLPALPLAIPGLLGLLGEGMPAAYRPAALALVGLLELALLLPERKRADGGRKAVGWQVAAWLAGVVAAPLALIVVAVRHYTLWSYPTLGGPDEGLLYYAAQRLAEGGVLYRDVAYPTGSGLPTVLSLVYHLTGPSVPVGKWVLAVVQVAGVLATYGLVRKLAGWPVAVVVALAVLPLSIPAGLTFALLSVSAAFMQGWRREPAWGLAGLLGGLAVLFDPVLGLTAILALVLMVGVRQLGLVRRRLAGRVDLAVSWQTLTSYVGMLALVTLPAAMILRLNGGWAAMWADLTSHPWGAISPQPLPTVSLLPLVEGGTGWAGVLAASARLDTASVTLLGLLAGGLLLWRLLTRQWTEDDFLALTFLFTAGLLTTRLVAVESYLPAVYLLAAYLAGWSLGPLGRAFTRHGGARYLLRAEGAALLLVLAAWPLAHRLAGERTSWSRPAAKPMSVVGLGTLTGDLEVPAAEARVGRSVARAVWSVTRRNDRILVVGNDPLLYFLADRAGAGRFAALPPTAMTEEVQRNLAQQVAKGRAKAVVVDTKMPPEAISALQPALRQQRMQPLGRYGPYQVLAPAEAARNRPPAPPGA